MVHASLNRAADGRRSGHRRGVGAPQPDAALELDQPMAQDRVRLRGMFADLENEWATWQWVRR
jgi:hypothetical protein